jgi:thiol-disulfide isomerase/thioredoxin
MHKFNSFFSQLAKAKEADKVVLIDYTAAWCGPCKVIAPILDKLAEAADSSRIEFYKVDVDAAPAITAAAHISSVCSLYILEYFILINRTLNF